MLEKRVHASITLHVGMLGYQERNGTQAQGPLVFPHHVVPHYLYILAINFQEEIRYDMSFGT